MVVEAEAVASMAVVVEAVSTVAAVEDSTAVAATEEVAVITAPHAAAAMAEDIAAGMAVARAAAITAATTIRCRLAAPIPQDVPAILTIHPRIADTPQAIAATTPGIAAIPTQRVTA